MILRTASLRETDIRPLNVELALQIVFQYFPGQLLLGIIALTNQIAIRH
jgi:hypothetical protein